MAYRIRAMTEYPRLAPGDQAPSFVLPNQDGKLVSLADYAGKKLIAYFFPAASTPGCTLEAVDFNNSYQVFKDAGYELIGIAPDPVEKLKNFKAGQKLKFELLSDEDKVAHKAFGAFGDKSLYGRIYRGVLRSTFVIDETGKFELALYSVKATGHVGMLRRKMGIS